MKHLLALAILITILPCCKKSPANKPHVDGFKVDYFTKGFFTYVNDNGWTVKRAGLGKGGLQYSLSHGDSQVEILMDYDQQAELATTFEFSFPKGTPATEALLQEILGSVDGIEHFAKVTENQTAEQAGSSNGG
jgi:hypothetical protein